MCDQFSWLAATIHNVVISLHLSGKKAYTKNTTLPNMERQTVLVQALPGKHEKLLILHRLIQRCLMSCTWNCLKALCPWRLEAGKVSNLEFLLNNKAVYPKLFIQKTLEYFTNSLLLYMPLLESWFYDEKSTTRYNSTTECHTTV